nr:immunoglobulin light chain junction region [Macaca mulatta]MOY11496.1 immunoglobulin light chain junction region [Macaca mulatta]MOY11775.1 immunoglobulin light chain junction region [Macaca mulatta]MOY11993.1 immunoglobulin light chain junction region [Macaca mulatta]MOY13987.1 immunoglobulin light chain junction region [Macaca mulatta]
CQQHDHSPWTF